MKRAYFDDCYSDDKTDSIVLTEHKIPKSTIKAYNDNNTYMNYMDDARLYYSDTPIVAYKEEWRQIIVTVEKRDIDSFSTMYVALTHEGANLEDIGPIFVDKSIRSKQWRSNVRSLLNSFGIDCTFKEA